MCCMWPTNFYLTNQCLVFMRTTSHYLFHLIRIILDGIMAVHIFLITHKSKQHLINLDNQLPISAYQNPKMSFVRNYKNWCDWWANTCIHLVSLGYCNRLLAFYGWIPMGSDVTITHEALDFTVQYPPYPDMRPHCTGPLDIELLCTGPQPWPQPSQELTSGSYGLKLAVCILLECFLVL